MMFNEKNMAAAYVKAHTVSIRTYQFSNSREIWYNFDDVFDALGLHTIFQFHHDHPDILSQLGMLSSDTEIVGNDQDTMIINASGLMAMALHARMG